MMMMMNEEEEEEEEDDDDDNNNNKIKMIIIAFKGAIPDLLQSPHCAENRLQHVRSSDPGPVGCKPRATHRALITCKRVLRAAWYEGTAQLLSLTELNPFISFSFLFFFRFFFFLGGGGGGIYLIS